LFVGVMLVTFGTFWSGQGLGVSWPGHDFALLWLGVGYMGSALVLLRLVVSWRRDALTAAQHQSVNGVQP
jgi:Ca2+/H+ antiporter, TMEM165/GDT1 family